MKPTVNPKVVHRVLVAIGTAFLALGEAPLGWEAYGWGPTARHLFQILGTLLIGKEMLPRSGDISIEHLPLEWRDSIPPQAGHRETR